MTWTTTTRTRHGAGATPDVTDVREGLRAALDPADFARVWTQVCSDVSVAEDATSVSEADLDALLTRIAGQDRLCNVLAMSWRIRWTAARRLAELGR